MRWRTPKRAKTDRAAAVERVEFSAQFTFCWNCGSNWDLCIDEMVSGMSDRVKGVQNRLAWTRLCGKCNTDTLAGSSPKVLITKLALKWIHDRPHFDLPSVCVMRGKAPGAIEMYEIIPTICRRIDGRAA